MGEEGTMVDVQVGDHGGCVKGYHGGGGYHGGCVWE